MINSFQSRHIGFLACLLILTQTPFAYGSTLIRARKEVTSLGLNKWIRNVGLNMTKAIARKDTFESYSLKQVDANGSSSNRFRRGVDDWYSDSAEEVVEYPFSLLSKSAFLVTKVDLHSTFNIFFKMKTTQRYGILFYGSTPLAGRHRRVFSVELWNGHVHYVYGTTRDLSPARWTRRSPSTSDGGPGGLRMLTDNLPRTIDDDKWHEVSVLRPNSRVHILQVDDAVSRDIIVQQHHQQSASMHEGSRDSKQSAAEDEQRIDQLFIGGLPGPSFSALPDKIRSSDGFQGCLASIYLAGRSWSPCSDDDPVEIPEDITPFIRHGCHDSVIQRETICEETGYCHHPTLGLCEFFSESGWTQCNSTGCSGSEREEESMAYTFGRNGGLLSYSFPATRRPNTKFDRLSFGFTTTQRDTSLITITSSSYADFIHVELVSGHVIVTYNIGAQNLTIGETLRSLSDGIYHVIRFTRHGPNATLQVDSLPTQTRNPTGRQMVTFNHQSMIVIGGHVSSYSAVTTGSVKHVARSFHGTMAGVIFNGLRLFDLAAEGDGRVSITGDVQMEVKPLRHQPGGGTFSALMAETEEFGLNRWIKEKRQGYIGKDTNYEMYMSSKIQDVVAYNAMTSYGAKMASKEASMQAGLLKQLNSRLSTPEADDLITSTSANVEGTPKVGKSCLINSSESVKCDDTHAATDAFIHPTLSSIPVPSIGNVTTVSIATDSKNDSQSNVLRRFEGDHVTSVEVSDTDRNQLQYGPRASSTTKKWMTLNQTGRQLEPRGKTTTTLVGLSTTSRPTPGATPGSRFPAKIGLSIYRPLTTVDPGQAGDHFKFSEMTTSADTSHTTTMLPVYGDVDSEISRKDGADYSGSDHKWPSSLTTRSTSSSRNLVPILSLIASVTAILVLILVLLIVYRYRITSTPSRRASLMSVTSLGYSKAPTADTPAPVNTRAFSEEQLSEQGGKRLSSSEFQRPCSGADNMAVRGELLGGSVMCTTYGGADAGFLTSSITRNACKTCHAKEWFV